MNVLQKISNRYLCISKRTKFLECGIEVVNEQISKETKYFIFIFPNRYHNSNSGNKLLMSIKPEL